jgi:DNA-binding response OmpR family regulator
MGTCERFQKEWVRFCHCEFGGDAMKAISAMSFDLVITDLKLPQIDGLEVAVAAKAKCPAPPVIMISAVQNEELQIRIRTGEIDCFVEKPFDLNEIVKLAGTFIQHDRESILRNT